MPTTSNFLSSLLKHRLTEELLTFNEYVCYFSVSVREAAVRRANTAENKPVNYHDNFTYFEPKVKKAKHVSDSTEPERTDSTGKTFAAWKLVYSPCISRFPRVSVAAEVTWLRAVYTEKPAA